MTDLYSLYRHVDVEGIGEDLFVEIWPTIEKGKRYVRGLWSWQGPDEITSVRVRITERDGYGFNVLLADEFDSVSLELPDGSIVRPRVLLKLGERVNDP